LGLVGVGWGLKLIAHYLERGANTAGREAEEATALW
jgi:hypothetical protein